MNILRRFLVALGLVAMFAGCTGQQDHGHEHPDPTPSATAEKHAEHGHHHTAPHGGALVVFGEEFAHLELVLTADSGTLTAYVLDGEAEKAVRLAGGTLEIMIKGGDKLVLQPVADVLTGETVEDTSTYRAQSDSLKGVGKFEATLTSLKIKGQDFANVEFHYPEGNESHQDHHHEHAGEHHEDEHPQHESL